MAWQIIHKHLVCQYLTHDKWEYLCHHRSFNCNESEARFFPSLKRRSQVYVQILAWNGSVSLVRLPAVKKNGQVTLTCSSNSHQGRQPLIISWGSRFTSKTCFPEKLTCWRSKGSIDISGPAWRVRWSGLKDDWVYIQHILDEIEYLGSLRCTITFEDLTTDRTTEHAVTRSLEIIGEASKNVPEKVKDEYPHIPWRFMAGLRDKIIHGYFAINYDIVWDVIQHKLPELKPQISALLDTMKPDDFWKIYPPFYTDRIPGTMNYETERKWTDHVFRDEWGHMCNSPNSGYVYHDCTNILSLWILWLI